MTFAPETYIQRRADLCSKLASKNILFLGNCHSPRNFKDNYYTFRQDSTFLYYFGITVPNIHAVLDTSTGDCCLFGDDPTIDDTVWIGTQTSVEALAESSGISKVYPLSQLSTKLNNDVLYLPPYRTDHQVLLKELLPLDKVEPSLDLIKAIVAQREIKTAEEIRELEKANKLSHLMHKAVIKYARVGMKEHELVALAAKFALDNHAEFAYQPILTTEGQILHNHHYHRELTATSMVLNDSGLELASGYCGDITRTFPASESFSPLQRDLYNIVHAAFLHAVQEAVPGKLFKEIHLSAAAILVAGLKEVGWMKGSPEEAVAAGAHTLFFQCGLGHMMGLDVHDMENYGEQYVGYDSPHIKSTAFGLKSLRLAKTLSPGHCITIEPGIYIIPELIQMRYKENAFMDFINYDKLIANQNFGGIRIEDNFIITPQGNKNLSNALPTDIDTIEALRYESAH